jgi:tetratricopeptide (TPR) repeat protein
MGTITAEVREALGESRSSLARHNVTIEEATTPSLDALKAYTEATTRRASGRETEAVPFFERAIALDPRFALAYTTLSTLYGGLGETGRSEELARLAYDNRDHVSERERLFITYQYHDRYTGDQTKARETLDVWKRTYPRDYRPANALAVLLNRLGDYDAAIEEAREAIRRNPEHAFPRSNLAYALVAWPRKQSRVVSAPVRCGDCCISSRRSTTTRSPHVHSWIGQHGARSASISLAPRPRLPRSAAAWARRGGSMPIRSPARPRRATHRSRQGMPHWRH